MQKMQKMPKKIIAFLLFSSLIIIVSCDLCWIQDCEDDENPIECSCDLQLTDIVRAYNEQEFSYLDCCLADDFVFHFDPTDSNDVREAFPLLKISRDRELEISENIFDTAGTVSLQLSGDEVRSYSGDPTGQSKLLPRNFELTVLFPDSSGYQISGECDFVVRPVGERYEITIWRDLSGSVTMKTPEIKGIDGDKSWGYVKWIFR